MTQDTAHQIDATQAGDGQHRSLGRIRVLHVEDSPLDADLALAKLARDELDVDITRVESGEAFAAALDSDDHFDLILSDYLLPGFDGMTALRMARKRRPEVPFIFVSGVLGEENAIDSLKLGATDYVLKQRLDRLPSSVRRALAECRERQERRRVEQALSRSQEQLRFTLDAVRIGHWELELTTGRSRYRSSLHDQIFGYDAPLADWSAKRLLDHIHPDDKQRAARALAAALVPGGRCEFECRIIRADGEERWIWIKGAHQVFSDDGIGSAAGLVMDVTERKLAEQERERLLRSEREARADAERASRLKDDFLATLSHELRTPLNAVLGWAQLLQRGVIPQAEWPQTMEVIERNAKLQAQLVEDLLDMSRITSGKLRLEAQETDLAGVVRAAVAAVRPGAEAKGLVLTETAEPGPLPVFGDPSRLQQVVWNLLSNAVKFTPAGGEVAVSVARCGTGVQVSVRDSGQGIEPAFLPHVFDRFRQQDGSTARKHGGLGVGLSIVRHLVELHGGECSAQSDGNGKGATFTVTLPLLTPDRADAVATPAQKFAPPCLRGVRVLVVEDEADTRQYIRRVLEDCEAEVLTADRAAAGLQQIIRHHPRLLLSDLGMPDQDGYEFIRKVRELPKDQGGEIPAIALTAYARPEDRQRALTAGFQLHMAKPIDPSKLLEAVAGMLAQTPPPAADGQGAAFA